MNAVDRLVAGARRAWVARRAIAPLLGWRGALMLLFAEVAAFSVEIGRPAQALVAVPLWIMMETWGGTLADVRMTRALGGPGSRAQRRALALGWRCNVLPWLVALAPLGVAGAVLLAGARPPTKDLVMPVLITTVATLIACGAAVALHLGVAAGYALGGARESQAWVRAHRGTALATWAVVASMRVGAAWLACLITSVVSRSSFALVAAIVVAGAATRGIALATWLVTVEETV